MGYYRFGNKNPFFGKKHTDKTKSIISKSNSKSKEHYLKKFIAVHNDRYDYSLLPDDIKSTDYIKILCPVHGLFEQKVYSHYEGYGCKKCATDSRKRDVNLLIEEWNDIHDNRYDYSFVDYINNTTKVKILCSIHGEFWQVPKYHSNGSGCPKCKSSKGENRIRKFLKRNEIAFEEQKTFDECYNELLLPFDFYLNQLNILIEYDGEQHFQIKWEGEEGLEKIKKRDKIKTKFCKDNKIELIRIDYKNLNNIESILGDYLENH